MSLCFIFRNFLPVSRLIFNKNEHMIPFHPCAPAMQRTKTSIPSSSGRVASQNAGCIYNAPNRPGEEFALLEVVKKEAKNAHGDVVTTRCVPVCANATSARWCDGLPPRCVHFAAITVIGCPLPTVLPLLLQSA